MTLSVLSLLIAIALLVGLFFWLKNQQDRGRPRRLNAQPKKREAKSAQRSTVQESRAASNQTRQQLRRLVNGDQAAAERLVKRVQLQNPDRSEQWCWEKAIHDVQRDRRV